MHKMRHYIKSESMLKVKRICPSSLTLELRQVWNLFMASRYRRNGCRNNNNSSVYLDGHIVSSET